VPVRGGEVQEEGDFELDGVTFPAAEVRLEFIDPAASASASQRGSMFPTGAKVDVLDVPGLGHVEVTLINAGNPTVFVEASALGLQGTELQPEVNGRPDLLAKAEALRAQGAVAMGLAATTEEAVQKRLDTVQGQIDAARHKPGADIDALDAESTQRVHEANRRMAELNAFEHNHPDERLDPSHPEEATHFHIGWLPNLVNIRLDQGWVRVKANLAAMKDGDADAKERFITGLFSVLPQTMLVLLPIFALLLKIVYIFRRRLYMEHMIVSLHSHAFLFLSVLLVALLSMLGSLLKPHAHWAYTTTGWLQAAIFIWMPVYLLLTQKRVYRQGWFKTVMKYFFAGFWYAWMLFWALLIAAAISLSH